MASNPSFPAPISRQGDIQALSLGSQIVTAIQGRPVAATAPTLGQALKWAGAQWTPQTSPGTEIGYDQRTSTINITGTTSGTATSVIAGSAYTFDGGAVIAEFFAPLASLPSVAGATFAVGLFEGSTLIAGIAQMQNPAAAAAEQVAIGKLRFTPTAGSHTYSIKAWVSSTTGTPNFTAGTGTSGATAPAYLRLTKV